MPTWNQLSRLIFPMLVLGGLFASKSFADIAGQLGPLNDFRILGLTGSTDNLSSGGLVVDGNIGVAANASAAISSGTVNGSFYVDPSGTVTQSGGENVPVIVQSLAAAQTAAINLATFAANAAKAPTQSFSSITSAMTITGDGGENVIDITGSAGIHLSGGNLTISGGPKDYFIIDVEGSQGMQLSGNTNIVLQGVSANEVLWYFPGTANNILQTSGDSDTRGIFLAPNGGIQINGGYHVSEFIAGGPLSFQSNPTIVPEPAWAPFCIIGAASLGMLIRRRLTTNKTSS